jgi:hypothetical protein
MTIQEKLDAYRAAAAHRRAAAFAPVPDFILGLPVAPLTPRVYSLLSAIGSPLVNGGTQPLEGDLRNYLWFSSRWFTTRPALARWLKPLVLLPLTARLRSGDIHRYHATLALALNDLRLLLDDVFADAPAGTGPARPGCPPTLEAQLVHAFATAYRWPPERTVRTPLRQLFQLLACLDPESRTLGEQSLITAHLRERNTPNAQPTAVSP